MLFKQKWLSISKIREFGIFFKIQISEKICLEEKLEKVSNNLIKQLRPFFFFSFFFWQHSASLLTPLMVKLFFHQMPEFSYFLDIAMLGSYKKIQMWMIIFKKTKLQMNGMPVHFQEWGSNQQMNNRNS